jgi:GNAT superfamily N-acetyltransferase
MIFVVRDVSENDYAAMCDIHVSAIKSISTGIYSAELKASWAIGLHPEGYAAGKAKGENYRVAANENNHVFGFSSTIADRLLALYVHPDAQGMGIGTLMLTDAERRIQLSGVLEARLKASLNAETFYAARGWIFTSFDNFVSRGGLTLKVAQMQKVFT